MKVCQNCHTGSVKLDRIRCKVCGGALWDAVGGEGGSTENSETEEASESSEAEEETSEEEEDSSEEEERAPKTERSFLTGELPLPHSVHEDSHGASQGCLESVMPNDGDDCV